MSILTCFRYNQYVKRLQLYLIWPDYQASVDGGLCHLGYEYQMPGNAE